MTADRRAPLTDEGRRLAEDNLKLAYAVVNRRYPYPCRVIGEREDVYQEAMVALLRAAGTYHPGLGYAFSSYAVTCINNWLNQLVLNAYRVKRRAARPPLSLDAPIAEAEIPLGETIPDGCDLEARALVHATVSTLRAAAGRAGLMREFEVLERNARGETFAEMARDRGVSRQALSATASRAAGRLRTCLRLK